MSQSTRARAAAPRSDDAVRRDVAALDALSTDTRYRLLRAIVDARDGICVCDLEPRVDVGQSAVSQALARLSEAGLVTRRKEGTWRYYAPTDRAIALLDALDGSRDHE